MMDSGWIAAAAVASVGAVLFFAWRPWRNAQREAELSRARDLFRRRREWLEARFADLAANSGKPRGLRWVDCEFDDDVTYARARSSGDLSALVAITIRFEAIEGGPMEDVEAVSNLRYATAVFRYVGQQWITDGRAIFNLNPTEAIEHFRASLIMIGQQPAQRS